MCYTHVEDGGVFVKVSLNIMREVGLSTLAGIVNYYETRGVIGDNKWSEKSHTMKEKGSEKADN